jgi:hypothetical protein
MTHLSIVKFLSSRILARSLFLLAVLVLPTQLTAQDQTKEANGGVSWKHDLRAFDNHLKTLVGAARIPTEEEFSERFKNGPGGELTSITDGAGGVIDFRPAKDTVQHRVNEALKGKAVRWEIELGADAGNQGQLVLMPKWIIEAGTEGKVIPFVNAIMFQRHQSKLPVGALTEGQRIVFEGTIGDALKNKDGLDFFHGATAIHYLQDVPHPIFLLGFDKVTVTRLDPTEEQLATQVLSDRPNHSRKSWKIIKEKDKGADFDPKLARHAFDGDIATVWRTTMKGGDPAPGQSLLVDMGRVETVTGIRCLPSTDDQGVIGNFSLYVSKSPDEMGQPVTTGAFTSPINEQEAGFEKVEGRYFRFVVHPVADEPHDIAVAELNLLGPAVEFPDPKRDPGLPPMAYAIERFELLHEKLVQAPPAMALTPAQQSQWEEIHRQAGSRWYDRHQRVMSDILTDKGWEAVAGAAFRENLSPVEDANFYAVAASPDFSTDLQLEEMAAMAGGMRETRLEFLSSLKRILSTAQQEELGKVVAAAAFHPWTGDGGWKDFFDGKTLLGWDGDPKFWSVQDGAITGTTTADNPTDGNTFLICVGESKDGEPAEFGDFELKLEYRIVGHNSGIQYRSFKFPGENDGWRVGGYQADFDAKKEVSGANYEEQGRGILAKRGQAMTIDVIDGSSFVGVDSLGESATLAEKIGDAPGWNELHIIAIGNQLSHKINGVLMSKVVDNDKGNRRASGLIAIELQEGTPMQVQVRGIRIRSNPKAIKLEPVAVPAPVTEPGPVPVPGTDPALPPPPVTIPER